jgi:hypothetical protein
MVKVGERGDKRNSPILSRGKFMVTVKTLRDFKDLPNTSLHCEQCGSDWSSNPSDYWNRSNRYVMLCCGKPLVLVRKETVWITVKR